VNHVNLDGPDFLELSRVLMGQGWFRALPPLGKSLLVVMAGLANGRSGLTRRGELLGPGELVCSHAWLAGRLAWKQNRHTVVPTVAAVRWALRTLRKVGAVSWTVTGQEMGNGLLISLDFLRLRRDGRGAQAGAATGTAATRKLVDRNADSIDRPRLEPRPGRARVEQRERLGLPQGEEHLHRGDGEVETGPAPEGGAAPPERETPLARSVGFGETVELADLLRARRIHCRLESDRRGHQGG